MLYQLFCYKWMEKYLKKGSVIDIVKAKKKKLRHKQGNKINNYEV